MCTQFSFNISTFYARSEKGWKPFSFLLPPVMENKAPAVRHVIHKTSEQFIAIRDINARCVEGKCSRRNVGSDSTAHCHISIGVANMEVAFSLARKLCDGLLCNVVLNTILVHRDLHKNIIIKLLYFDSPFRCWRGCDMKAIIIYKSVVMRGSMRIRWVRVKRVREE